MKKIISLICSFMVMLTALTFPVQAESSSSLKEKIQIKLVQTKLETVPATGGGIEVNGALILNFKATDPIVPSIDLTKIEATTKGITLDTGTTLDTRISNTEMTTNNGKDIEIPFKADIDAYRNQSIKLYFKHADDPSVTFQDSKFFSLGDYVKSVGPGDVTVNNFPSSKNVLVGDTLSVTADLVNLGTADAQDVVVTLQDASGAIYASQSISNLQAKETIKLSLDATGFHSAKKYSLFFKVKYLDSASVTQTNQSSTFTVNAINENTSSLLLRVQKIDIPTQIHLNSPTTLSLFLTNSSKNDFTNVEAFLYDSKGNEVDSKYIGTISSNTSNGYDFTFTPTKSGSQSYSFKVIYKDASLNQKTLTYNIKLTVLTDGTDGDASAGYLKIQKIYVPSSAIKDSETTVDVYITNPTAVSIKGAEAFLYNSKGELLDSMYISSIEANTSQPYSFNYIFPTAGSHSLIAKVVYKNSSNKTITISKSITVNIKSESGSDEPAELKIQKINNPNIFYANTLTEVSYVLVNAGKGDAYNVEIYVVDAFGNELAREYVGHISSSSKQELTFQLKLTDIGDGEADFYVYYQNGDDTSNEISRRFTYRVMQYRANIMDVYGYEYMEVGFPATIEFAVLNSGNETMYNCNAYLLDADGNEYGNLYIGTIEPGKKMERQKFKNVSMFMEGSVPLTILVQYENRDMQVFDLTTEIIAQVFMPYYPEPEFPGGEFPDFPEEEPEAQGFPWWGIVLIVCGVLAAGAVVTVIVVRKKKKIKDDDDDMEYYYTRPMPSMNLQQNPITEEQVNTHTESN